MAYLSNSELLISDDSIGNLLDTLEKDEDYERLLSSHHESFVRPVFAEPQKTVNPVPVAPHVPAAPARAARPKRRRRNPVIILASVVLFLVALPMLLYRPVISKYRQPPIGPKPVSQNLEQLDETLEGYVTEKTVTSSSSMPVSEKGYVYDLLFPFESSDIEQCQNILGCPVKIEENKILIGSDRPESELLSSLKSELDSLMGSLNDKPEFINIKTASADDSYSEYSVVVTAVNLNMMEREAVRALFAPAALYNSISHSEAQSIRVNFYNMLGNVVNYMDSAEF